MIQKAQVKDIPILLEILKGAILNLKENHVPQWQNGYPNEKSLFEDIKKEQGYIFLEKGKIIGYSTVILGEDPSYEKITGQWLTKGPYATFHRVMMASTHQKGTTAHFFDELEKQAKKMGAKSIRIDTHEKNKKMRKRLKQQGFTRCGEIILHDTKEPRFAYEKVI